jgi:hypothetical protein
MTFDVGALGAYTASACCLVGTTRSRRAWISAVLMVLSMIGCVLMGSTPGVGLLSFVLALGSAGFALVRVSGRVPPMSLHRALGGITMAALVGMSLGRSTAAAATRGHIHGMSLGALVSAFAAGYLVYTAWLVVDMLRSGRRTRWRSDRQLLLAVGETAGMGAGVVLMALM